MAKTKAVLFLAKSINKKKISYIDAFNKTNLATINKKIPDRNEVAKMSEIKLIISKNKHITSTQLRSGIQSIQSRFKSVKLNYGIKDQVDEPVKKENTITYIANISID